MNTVLKLETSRQKQTRTNHNHGQNFSCSTT